MIRRDVRLPDGAAGWMLISQVEHARISAQLAEHCLSRFPSERAGASPPPASFQSAQTELLNAIAHHDDGWRDWEQAPKLDPKHGRPLAFTELTPAAAVAIWSRSVDAAAEHGPLAAATVAGHFLRLASKSDATRTDNAVVVWRTDMQSRRDEWLVEWRAIDPLLHTQAVADEALQWLWTFDEVSLWFCCTCMHDERSIPYALEPHRAGRGTPVEMELVSADDGVAFIEPWRFDDPVIDLQIDGVVVPARSYTDPAELLAAAVPKILHWRATPA